MRTYLRGGLILALALLAVVWATLLILRVPHPPTCPHCVLAPQLGPNVYISQTTWHSYHLQDGVYVDMGRVTPVPGVNR